MVLNARKTETLLWILAAAFFSYTVVRASIVSITHDEAFSQIYYGVKSYLEIAKSPAPHIPNNHILNTLLFKASAQLFGLSHFTIRLPNLLFYAAFLVFSIIWLRSFKSNTLKICGFLLLHANVYVLDFFALARGYGMGCALLFISLFYLFRYRDTKKTSAISYGIIAAALATYANFTFLYAFVAVALTYNLQFVAERNNWKILLKKNLPIGSTAIGLAFLIVLPLKKISGDLFGGADSFFDNTVKSLSHSYLYSNSGKFTMLLAYLVVCLFLLALIFLLFKILKKRHFISSKFSVASSVLVVVILMQIVQHHILGTPYITHRTAILYFPLFTVFLICWLQVLWQQGVNAQKFALALSVLLAFGAALNTVLRANLKSAFEWQYDAYNEDIVKDLTKMHTGENIRLGNTWFYEPGLNFYKQSKPLPWLHTINRESLYAKNDYYLVNFNMNPDFLTMVQTEIKLVKSYSEDIKLYKRTQ